MAACCLNRAIGVSLLLLFIAATNSATTLAPLCRRGRSQKPLECRPQSWGASDSGILNASLVVLGLGCSANEGGERSSDEQQLQLPAGSVALVARGGCPFAQKAAVAGAMGAVAVIFYDPKDPVGDNIMSTTGSPVPIPVVAVGRDDGERLVADASKRRAEAENHRKKRNKKQQPIPTPPYPYVVSITFSSKWALERAEDRWRRAAAAPNATSEVFLFHGSVLAQLLRHGQAMRSLRRAVELARSEAAAGRPNASKVEADAAHDLAILDKTWRNESTGLWEDFAARRAPARLVADVAAALASAAEATKKAVKVEQEQEQEEEEKTPTPGRFGGGVGGAEVLEEARRVVERAATRMQAEFGLDLWPSPTWPEDGTADAFRTSDRYGDGLAEHYACTCSGSNGNGSNGNDSNGNGNSNGSADTTTTTTFTSDASDASGEREAAVSVRNWQGELASETVGRGEKEILKKEGEDGGGCRLRVAVETWRFLSASYAVVGVNTLVQLAALQGEKDDGDDGGKGKGKGEGGGRFKGVCVSVLNPPLYEGGWRHEDGLYPAHVESLLRRLPLASAAGLPCPDVVLRIYFPFDLDPFPCGAARTIVFGTSEFGISSDRALKRAMEWGDMDPSVVFMTPSAWSAEGFVRSGMRREQTWVVPHGIDPEVFHPPASAEARAARREELGWGDASTVVFLNVGMMSHNKGLKEMLAAFNMLWKWNERWNDEAAAAAAAAAAGGGGDDADAAAAAAAPRRSVKLVFKGPSHIPPHLDSREVKRGGGGGGGGGGEGEGAGGTERQWFYQGRPLLDDDVASSTDAIEVIANSSLSSAELASLMGAADVYLSAYKAEGFNLPVLEAMATGTPCVVTRGGPTDDFTTAAFAKYAAGEVVPGSMASISDLGQEIVGYELQADARDLFDRMREAVEDAPWRVRAGAAAARHARDHYTWRSVVETMVADERFSGQQGLVEVEEPAAVEEVEVGVGTESGRSS